MGSAGKLFVLEHSDAVAVITGLAHREVLVALAEGESVEIGGRPGSFQLEHFFVTGSEALDGFTPWATWWARALRTCRSSSLP